MSPTPTTILPQPEYVDFSCEGSFSSRREVVPLGPAASGSSVTSLPLIDISRIFSPILSEREAVARKLADASEHIGFMYVTGHGVDAKLQQGVFDVARSYFDLPIERKMESWIYNTRHLKGYEPVHGARVDPNVKLGDKKEAFLMAYEPALESVAPVLSPQQAAMIEKRNCFPPDLPEFKEKLFTYHSQMLGLSRQLMRTFALALGVGETYFDDHGQMNAPNTALKVIHYPPQDIANADETGIGAHTDSSCFTLLATSAPGLELLNAKGHWIPAPPVPAAFIMNIGDFLMRMSNGRFLSTVHQVKNITGIDRYSIPFFFITNLDAPVEVLRTCQSPVNPPKYKSELVGEIYSRRHAQRIANFQARQRETECGTEAV